MGLVRTREGELLLSERQHEFESNTPRSAAARLRRLLTEADTATTLLGFALLAAVVVGARLLADLAPSEISRPWLLGTAIGSNVPLCVAGVLAFGGLWRFGGGPLLVRWDDLDRGQALRGFTIVLVVMLTWRHLAADFDYAYGQWWALDRVGLVVFGALAVWRPIALVAFIGQIRLLQAPLRTAFGLASGATLDDLPILALAALVATVLVTVVVGGRKSHVFVNLMAAATAAQFFASGRRKLSDGWLADNDLSNFPLNGYHQGWLATGDGSLAEALAEFFATFRLPILVATVVLEVGGIVLLARRRSLIFAFVGWAGFHLFVFLGYGFSFLEWALVELGVVALLFGTAGALWSKPAFRAIPVALTVAFVFFGGFVFKPPTLAWFDGPMTYAYEFNGIDEDGNERLLVANDFAPHESAIAFAYLHLGPTSPLAAGYGALNRQRLDDLADVANWEQVSELETSVTAQDQRRDRAVANIERFLLESRNETSIFDRLPNGLTRYSTERDGQNYTDGTALVSLSVTRITTLRTDGDVLVRREPVVVFTVDDGAVTAVWVEQPT